MYKVVPPFSLSLSISLSFSQISDHRVIVGRLTSQSLNRNVSLSEPILRSTLTHLLNPGIIALSANHIAVPESANRHRDTPGPPDPEKLPLKVGASRIHVADVVVEGTVPPGRVVQHHAPHAVGLAVVQGALEEVAKPAEHALHVLGVPHDGVEGAAAGGILSAVAGVEADPEDLLEVDALGRDGALAQDLVRGVDVAREDRVALGEVGPHAVEEVGSVDHGASDGWVAGEAGLRDGLEAVLRRDCKILEWDQLERMRRHDSGVSKVSRSRSVSVALLAFVSCDISRVGRCLMSK